MADLASEIRLAVDTGKVAIGSKEVLDAIRHNEAKLIIIAKADAYNRYANDIKHNAKLANIKIIEYNDTSKSLGVVCGKPYPVLSLAIIDQGTSNILNI
ncbi:MAG: 50S ribosomal protein L30e [Candidatus Micrarchaeota archaeon]|nr:MAG: 50S ribosomal protein L30e [Candidatus Micrarchaeota archaeon]